MANYYKGRIQRGKLTIEEVPEKWREAVLALLDAE